MSNQVDKRLPFWKSVVFSLILMGVLITCVELLVRTFTKADNLSAQSEALPFWVISNLDNANFIADRLLFWRVPPSTPRLYTNSRGLVGPEFSIIKEPDVCRIITLGDSCTWGFGVKPGFEYPKVLNRILDQTSVPAVFEVENAGIPGFSSLQGLRYLESELLDYNPDIITLYFGRNDRRSLHEEGGYAPDHEVYVPPVWVAELKSILNRLRSYQILRRAVLNLRSPSREETLGWHHTMRSERSVRVEADEFERNIRGIITLARDNNAVPLAITSPVYPSRIGNYNDLLKQICDDQDVWILDAAEEFAQRGSNEWLVDDCHPNPAGHQWIAEQLSRKIIAITISRGI
jgi:lysophospholipase L1-like esterase